MCHGDGVAVAGQVDERFGGDRGAVQESVVMGAGWQSPTLGGFLRQPFHRWCSGCIGWPAIRHLHPFGRPAPEIRIIGKRSTGQEVALDPLDQGLDRSLLDPSAHGTGLRMEAELGGKLTQQGMPDRRIGHVPTGGHRLHVVEDEDPRHPAEGTAAGDQAAQERLLSHVGGPAQPVPSTGYPLGVEATAQEVAGRCKGTGIVQKD